MIDLSSILANIVRVLYNDGQLGSGQYTPARLADYLKGSVAVADLTVLLSQIALTVCIVFAGIIMYIAIKRRTLTATRPETAGALVPDDVAAAPISTGALRTRWTEIVAHLDSTHENDWKQAILEADKLADASLMKAGFAGDTFGDRLTNIAPGMLLSLDGLWWAHRIRNRVAHELDYFLRYTEARQAMSYYEAALSELQLI